LPQLAQHIFFAHMAMHMAVVAVAAALLACGVGGGPFDPVRKFPRLFSPIPASVLELVIVWAWHAPGLHHVARHTSLGLVAEQTMFLGSGLLVWLSAVGGERPRCGSRIAAGIVGLLLTSMHMTLLGALLIFAPRSVYGHAEAVSVLTPIADQQLGGAIMVLVGGVSYLVGGIWLTAQLLKTTDGKVATARVRKAIAPLPCWSPGEAE
jgi:putative membrane protein